ncbi:MAG: hypothetical protein E4H05_08500 [Acidimicrobiales bacterium]|nr:MAG: hypothetical protein E4H05_08500 [Acidimicrobiales bacterium]
MAHTARLCIVYVGHHIAEQVRPAILALTRRPPDVRRERIDGTLAPNLVASLFGFFVVFGFAGATFLDVFAVPGYDVELWHFAAAVLLGRRCRWVLPEDAFSGATSGRS